MLGRETICEDRTRRIASRKSKVAYIDVYIHAQRARHFIYRYSPPVFTPPCAPSSNAFVSSPCVSPPFFFIPIKSLEASRRGRERRLVTFPSRPLFLSSYARVRMHLTHTYSHIHTHARARIGTVIHVYRASSGYFLPFCPFAATTLPFPSSRELGVSRCILMKKFVTSLRHPAAAAAVAAAAAAVAPAKKERVGKRNEWFLTAVGSSISSRDRVYPFGYVSCSFLCTTSVVIMTL